MAEKKSRLVTVTALGVSAEADPDALDDYDLFETISEHGVSSFKAIEAVGNAFFGDEYWRTIKDALRGEDGKLKITDVRKFLDEASNQVEALKN